MPTSQGRIWPELNLVPADNNVLRVLIMQDDGFDIFNFDNLLNVVGNYIEDRHASSIRIEVLYQASDNVRKYEAALQLASIDIEDTSANGLSLLFKEKDIDIIYSTDKQMLLDLIKTYTPISVAGKMDELKLEIESFLTGKNIAWSFDNPTWNNTWLAKYGMSDGLTKKYFDYLNKAQAELEYTAQQVGYVRALVNKVGQVKYAQEQLLALIHSKNKSERNMTIQDTWGYDCFYDYSFEISFHLGNYYFLLSSCLDIVGRLYNDVYDLQLDWLQTNIENNAFRSAVKKKNLALFEAVRQKELSDWSRWLKARRNHIAHAAAPSYSDVLMAKKNKLSDSELEDRVKQMPVIMRMLSSLPTSVGESVLNQAKFVVRLHEDNKVLTRDALQVAIFNHKTQEYDSALFHPLVDIKLDYEKFFRLMSGICDAVT